MDFTQLDSALDEGQALSPLTSEEVKFRDEQLADQAFLKIVLQDVISSEQYLGEKALPQDWDLDDELYRAYVKQRTWPGTDVPRANLGMPLVLETIETLLPQIHLGFFSDKKPFLLAPVGRTTPEAARATSDVLVWAIKKSGFKEETRKILKSILQYGFGVGQWGWKTEKHIIKTYARKVAAVNVSAPGAPTTDVPSEEVDEIVATPVEHTISRPTWEYCDNRTLLVDRGCRNQDIRNAKFVVKQIFITADDLDDLRNVEGYKNIPTRAELVEILSAKNAQTKNSLASSQTETVRELQAADRDAETSVDPLKQPLEILEYWTDDRVFAVLQRVIPIRNEDHGLGSKPFLSSAFIDVLNSMFGFGIARLLKGEQMFEQGVVNSWIDSLALRLNPQWHRKKGMGSTSQTIATSPGKVHNDDGDLAPLPTESVSAEALSAIQTSEARAARRVGANGGSEMPSQAMRTAEGVQAFSAGITARLQYFIEIFSDLVFIPALEAMVQVCKDNLKPSQIRVILSEAGAKAYEGDILDVYNGAYKIDVLASTKLAARRAMANLIPMLIQLFSSEPVQDSLAHQNKKVDYAELVQQAFDLIGMDSANIVVEMTEEDQARAAATNSPAAVKAQADAAKQAQAHQNTLEDIQAGGEAKAGVAVVKHVLKMSESHDKTPVTGGDTAAVHNELDGFTSGSL
jgi:hypothetical protein